MHLKVFHAKISDVGRLITQCIPAGKSSVQSRMSNILNVTDETVYETTCY